MRVEGFLKGSIGDTKQSPTMVKALKDSSFMIIVKLSGKKK